MPQAAWPADTTALELLGHMVRRVRQRLGITGLLENVDADTRVRRQHLESGPAQYLAAVIAERSGMPVRAINRYRAALLLPGLSPVLRAHIVHRVDACWQATRGLPATP